MGHEPGEKKVVIDDEGEVEHDVVPDIFRYNGFCIVNGTIVHYYI